MKIDSTYLSCLATLLFTTIHLQVYATITIELDGEDVYVNTSEQGVSGYQGCDLNSAKIINAYVYTLFKKVEQKSGGKGNNLQTCSNNSRWVKVAEKTSNSSTEFFPKMGEGEYKATVYAGQAIGCTITGDTKDFPKKSIVYQQEKSTPITLNGNTLVYNNSNTNSINDKDALKIFPNPTSGNLHIQIKDHILQSDASITFYDLLGQEAMTTRRSINDGSFQEWQVDVSHFSEGAYILRVSDQEGNSYEKKVIVTDHQ